MASSVAEDAPSVQLGHPLGFQVGLPIYGPCAVCGTTDPDDPAVHGGKCNHCRSCEIWGDYVILFLG